MKYKEPVTSKICAQTCTVDNIYYQPADMCMVMHVKKKKKNKRLKAWKEDGSKLHSHICTPSLLNSWYEKSVSHAEAGSIKKSINAKEIPGQTQTIIISTCY